MHPQVVNDAQFEAPKNVAQAAFMPFILLSSLKAANITNEANANVYNEMNIAKLPKLINIWFGNDYITAIYVSAT